MMRQKIERAQEKTQKRNSKNQANKPQKDLSRSWIKVENVEFIRSTLGAEGLDEIMDYMRENRLTASSLLQILKGKTPQVEYQLRFKKVAEQVLESAKYLGIEVEVKKR